MTQRHFLLMATCAILLVAYGLMPVTLPVRKEIERNANENPKSRSEWEREMLGDPQTGKIPEGISIRNIAYLHEVFADQLHKKKQRGDAEWTNRGPWNVGGRTRTMVVDVNNPYHLIAGAVSGGIWESEDGGISWKRVSDVNDHPGIVSITQDTRPGKTNIWYALSGEIYGTSASGIFSFYLGDGAYLSTDNGTTWKPLSSTAGATPNNFTSNFQGGWRIVASPVDSVAACVYMATYGTIYRSTDTGKIWKPVLGNGNNSYFTDVAVSSMGIVYAALSSSGSNTKGFYRSADGVHFTRITPDFIKSHNRTVIEINPNNENEVYFLSELPSDTSGGVTTTNYEGVEEYVSLAKYTYLSGDGTGSGGNWVNLSSNLPVTAENAFDRFNVQGGYDIMVKVQPGTNAVFIGGTNIYRSGDGFTTPLNTQFIGGYGKSTSLPFFTVYLNHHPDQHDLLFLKSNPLQAYSINDGGIMYTENINAPEVEWQSRTQGYLTTQLYTVTIDEETPYDPYLIGGFQDNGNYISTSTNPTHQWYMPVNGDGAYSYIAPDKSYFVMSTQLGRIVKIELNKHGHLLARRRIDPAGFEKSNYRFINPFIVDTKYDVMYLPIGRKLARLNKLSSIPVNNVYEKLQNQWFVLTDSIRTPFNTAFNTESEITALACASNESILYIGTNNREMYRITNPHTGDPQWTKLDTGIVKRLPVNAAVSGIAVDPDDASKVLICYSNYNIISLYYSEDYGDTWYYVGGNLERPTLNPTGAKPSIRSVAILKGSNGKRTYFAGTSIGLFSTDTLVLANISASSANKTNWKQEGSDRIGAAVVTDIKTRQQDGYVAIGTHGNGTFESYYRGNAPAGTPSYADIQIYPVPASSTLFVSFDATNTNFTRAEVYDISGRRVDAFTNGINHNQIFTQRVNVSNYPNGHYFITFYMTNKEKQVKHFIVAH